MKPRIASKPFVIALADGTVRVRNENRTTGEGGRIRLDAGGYSGAGRRTFDHHDTHNGLLSLSARGIIVSGGKWAPTRGVAGAQASQNAWGWGWRPRGFSRKN